MRSPREDAKYAKRKMGRTEILRGARARVTLDLSPKLDNLNADCMFYVKRHRSSWQKGPTQFRYLASFIESGWRLVVRKTALGKKGRRSQSTRQLTLLNSTWR